MSLKTFPYFWKFEVEWSFWNIQILTSMIKDIMLGNLGTHFCSLFFRVHRPSLAENIVVCSPNPPPSLFSLFNSSQGDLYHQRDEIC